jgi:hypothetical protein
MTSLFIFGLGYTAARIAAAARAKGWEVHATGSAGNIAFDDAGSVRIAMAQADYILSSVPPVADGDPVLSEYGDAIRGSEANAIAYLSSTGVYGDADGAWVDESAPIQGRRLNRNEADQDWLALGARVYRLPGIYGPGRSALDRVAEGKAHRIDLPDQIFSRVHVDDIVSGVMAGWSAPSGAYNLSDDLPCSQNRVIEAACDLLGLPHPPLQSLERANLSAMALAFYGENRRVANGKAQRVMGWKPRYPTYVEGLRALSATTSPASANAHPETDSNVQT